MHELPGQSLIEVCRRIKSGELSSSEVVDAQLRHIEQREPHLHSFVRIRSQAARAEAERLDAAQAAGEPLGLLHGVPIAIKDLVFTAGEPTASGTRVMADYVPQFDATVLTRLQEAGAVIIGKTQLTEGAFGSHHPAITPPVNPWHPDYWTGVSSSGSGVSVAAGMAFGALGTDTGGSIRFPSACCGLVGIKPTYGRVSRHGVFELAGSLDHIGPMARSVADAARLLRVMVGHDAQDASSLDTAPEDFPADARDMRGATIGVDWNYVNAGVGGDVVEVIRDALTLCDELGARIVEVEMPPAYAMLVAGWGITCGAETARAHAAYYPARKQEYGPVLSGLIELGHKCDGRGLRSSGAGTRAFPLAAGRRAGRCRCDDRSLYANKRAHAAGNGRTGQLAGRHGGVHHVYRAVQLLRSPEHHVAAGFAQRSAGGVSVYWPAPGRGAVGAAGACD